MLQWDFKALGWIDHPGDVLWGVGSLNVEHSPSLTQHPSISPLLFFSTPAVLGSPEGWEMAALFGTAPALQGGLCSMGLRGFTLK